MTEELLQDFLTNLPSSFLRHASTEPFVSTSMGKIIIPTREDAWHDFEGNYIGPARLFHQAGKLTAEELEIIETAAEAYFNENWVD